MLDSNLKGYFTIEERTKIKIKDIRYSARYCTRFLY